MDSQNLIEDAPQPVCPHCGHVDYIDAGPEYDGGSMECENCGEEYFWRCYIHMTFDTWKPRRKS